MNSQDFRNLQEAYLEVYSVDELGEGLRILPREKMKFKAASKRLKATASEIKSKFTTSKGTTERNVVDAKNKRLRLQADKMDKSAAEHTPADAMGKERDNRSRSYGSSNPMGSNEYAERQYAKNRAKLGVKEQYDLYDIILSHLLDEGYAETLEQAEVIMVNMSEDWRESICEGRIAWDDKKNPNPSGYTPAEKNKAKIKQLGVNDPNKPSFEKGGPGENAYARHASLASTQAKMDKQSKSIFNKPKGKLHKFSKNPFWDMTKGQVNRMMGINKDRTPSNKRASYGMDT